MPFKVGPKIGKATHHLGLIDSRGRRMGLILCGPTGEPEPYNLARNPLVPTSLKITQGNPKYSDYELPFSPIAQDDFQGGRGSEDFEKDVSRYLDSRRLNTMFPGKAFNGPLDHFTIGIRSQNLIWPGGPYGGANVYWQPMMGDARRGLAHAFTTLTAWTAARLVILVRRVGTPTQPLNLRLYADSTSNPGTALVSTTVTTSDVTDWATVIISKACSQAMTSATKYWLGVDTDGTGDEANHWEVAVSPTTVDAGTKESADMSTWGASACDLYYRVVDDPKAWGGIFFEYRGSLYFVTRPDDNSASTLYINGDRGVADSNSGDLTKLNDATKAWITDQWIGSVAKIIGGPGFLEDPNYRKITANTGTALTLEGAWLTTHDATLTEYIIVGSNYWTSLGAVSAAAPAVMDVITINSVVYFARGTATAGQYIRRHREYNNAGVWTNTDWADDGTSQADYLCVVNDKTNGPTIWRATNSDLKVSSAPPVAWGTNLTFAAGILVGDLDQKFTGLIEYVDPDTGDKILWMLKEDSVWALKSGKADMVPLKEMRAVASIYNGKGILVHNLYLFFTLMAGLERYYSGTLTDVGPNLDRGFPPNRQGPIVHLHGYPGRFFAAIDAGSSGFSSVMMQNGKGYEEHYRLHYAGMRARRIWIQVVPGTQPDRLWIATNEGDLIWLNMPSLTLDATQDTQYQYSWEGILELGHMSAGMSDVQKLFDTLKLATANLAEGTCWVEADYRMDSETDAWTRLPADFVTSPTEEIPFSEGAEITGKWGQIRLRFMTSNAALTPVLKMALLNTIVRVPNKVTMTAQVRLKDEDVDLRGHKDDEPDCMEKIALLDEWADSLNVLTLVSTLKVFHGLQVFVDMPRLRPYFDARGEHIQGYVGTLPITQVRRTTPNQLVALGVDPPT